MFNNPNVMYQPAPKPIKVIGYLIDELTGAAYCMSKNYQLPTSSVITDPGNILENVTGVKLEDYNPNVVYTHDTSDLNDDLYYATLHAGTQLINSISNSMSGSNAHLIKIDKASNTLLAKNGNALNQQFNAGDQQHILDHFTVRSECCCTIL